MPRVIRNKKTGEVRVIDEKELSSYGIGTQAQAQTGSESSGGDEFKKLLLAAALADPKNISKYTGLSSLAEGLYPKQTDKEKEKAGAEEDFERITKLLENQYFGLESGEKEIGRGRLGGLLSKGKAAIGLDPRLRNYEALVQSVRPTLAKAAGDVGNLALQEQIAAGKLLPTAFSTPEESRGGFEILRERFGAQPREGIPQRTSLQNLLEAIPAITGTAGSIGGGILGGVAGSVVPGAGTLGGAALGGGAGGAIGGGAGYALQDLLAEILGEEKQSSKGSGQKLREAVGTSLEQGATGAVEGGVGYGIGKLGSALNPMAKGNTVRSKAISSSTGGKVKVKGKTLARAVEDWADDAVDAYPNQSQKIKDYVESSRKQWYDKEFTPEQAQKIFERNSGYTSSGKKAKGLIADYQRAVREAVREPLDEITGGEFGRGTSLMAQGYERSRLGLEPKQLGATAVKQGVSIAAALALLKALGVIGVNPNPYEQ